MRPFVSRFSAPTIASLWIGAARRYSGRAGLDRLYTVLRDLEDVPLTPVADELPGF